MASHFTTPQNMADLIVATGQCVGHPPKVMKISGSKCTLANITLMSPVQQRRDVHFRLNGRLPISYNNYGNDGVNFQYYKERGQSEDKVKDTCNVHYYKIHLRSEVIVSLLMNNNYNNHNSLIVVSLSPRFRVQTMIIKGVFGSVRFLVETQMKKQLLHMTSIRQ